MLRESVFASGAMGIAPSRMISFWSLKRIRQIPWKIDQGAQNFSAGF